MRLFVYLFLIIYIASPFAHAKIIMGIVPQQSPLKLMKVWNPIAKYLSTATGEEIVFKTEKSINKFEKVLYNGGYDFAYMNPYHYVIANKKQNYQAQVRATKNIQGILVMKESDTIQKLQDKNTKYLFPSPNAFAATLLTKYELLNQYNINVDALGNVKYVNSHDSVYKGVSRGVGDIGGGIVRTFKNINNAKLKDSLKIVHTTKKYPSHPFAFRPDMNHELQGRIVKALLEMPDELLKSLSVKSMKKTDNSEYKSVKELAKKLNILDK